MGKKKILIIDDEENFTALVKMNLEKTNMYEVIVENESARGVAAVKRFQPDLILLDLLMAGMEGSEVASRIRTDATIKNIPIVFLTASITKEKSSSGDEKDIGGHTFMAKPVSAGELINCIESNLKRQ